MHAKVTFVIPSIGRPSIHESIRSLLAQRIPAWKAIVVFDAVDEPPSIGGPSLDPRIRMIHLPEKTGSRNNWGGDVRNVAMQEVDTEWLAFLDDDDMVVENYLDMFEEELRATPNLDVVLFRIKYHDKIIPQFDNVDFFPGNIGIAAIMRASLCHDESFYFMPGGDEDLRLFSKLREAGKRIVISPYVGYYVRSPMESLRHRFNCNPRECVDSHEQTSGLAALLAGSSWTWWNSEIITFLECGRALWSYSSSAAFTWSVHEETQRSVTGNTPKGLMFRIDFNEDLDQGLIFEGDLPPRETSRVP